MYHYQKRTELSFGEAEQRLREALKKRGFGVLTVIDVQKTLKEKINLDVPAHKILGACNPQFASKVLAIEPDIGVLLPCNVVLRQEAGAVVVSCVLPSVQMMKVGNDLLVPIAAEVESRLKEAVDEATA